MAIYQGNKKVAGGIPAGGITKINNKINNATRYIPLTAGANGDFYCDLGSGFVFEEGMTLKFKFPTATDGSANARLSIDGASGTFRNFQMGTVNLLAEELEERNIVCVYDGTNWGREPELAEHKAESANKHITESGSNSGGEYIRFDDGTQICTKRRVFENVGAGDTVGIASWVFPAQFKENSFPIISVTGGSSSTTPSVGATVTAGSYAAQGNDEFRARCVAKNTDSSIRTIYMYLSAIGRWK